MAQEFVVLKCCECHIFQVFQSKKATKWLCKVCNKKQSIKQFFGSGSAKHCREIVQHLNSSETHEEDNYDNNKDMDSKILQFLQSNDDKNWNNWDQNEDNPIVKKVKLTNNENSFGPDSGFTKVNQLVNNKKVSKWDQFL